MWFVDFSYENWRGWRELFACHVTFEVSVARCLGRYHRRFNPLGASLGELV
jgi:hypothetical protein